MSEESETPWLARVHIDDFYIELRDGDDNFEWWPSDTEDAHICLLCAFATEFSRPPFYSYSTSHGHRGGLLADQIAEKTGGDAEFPKRKAMPKGTIY